MTTRRRALFSLTARELEAQEAIEALERVLARTVVDAHDRRVLEAAISVLERKAHVGPSRRP